MKITDFLAKTASSEPTPGGGSVAALCGAVACALTSMVAALTVNNEKYAGVSGEMKQLMDTAKGFIVFFTEQMDADAHAFKSVMEAYRMPKGSDEEKKLRSAAIQICLKGAAEVPLLVAQKALEAMDIAEKAVEKGNSQAVTDGAVAAMMARTAILSALYNVEINLASIRDADYREKIQSHIWELRDRAAARERQILEKVRIKRQIGHRYYI